MDALVEKIGDEILARVGGPGKPAPEAVTLEWRRPVNGYASVLETLALGPRITADSLNAACEQAVQLDIRLVWTASSWTPRAHRRLRGTAVRVGATIGYPFGDSTPAAKCCEAESALLAGAEELLTTLNAGAWLSAERDRAYGDLLAVCELAAAASAPVTVAVPADQLDDTELVRIAIAARLAGATAIQCSGWTAHSAPSASKVSRLAASFGDDLIIGVAGCIDGFSAAAACASAGADRIGVADPAAVLRGTRQSSGS